MKTSLRTLKRIGGEWRTDYHPAVDGDKYVCMDRIISTSPCLIYSYGIRDDWTFEDYMAGEHRCTVWAHDHTVQYTFFLHKKPSYKKVRLKKSEN